MGVILADGENLESERELEVKLEEHKFKLMDFPVVDSSVTASHPFTDLHSPSIAAQKVYPALVQHIKVSGY